MSVAPRYASEEGDDAPDVAVDPVVDHGELSHATRRALLQLVRGPYLRGDDRPEHWAALDLNEGVIRAQLANMYLDLVLDREARIAFVRHLDVEQAIKVVRNHPLTVLDTALVLFLRRSLLANQGVGTRTFVGRDEIEDQLRSFRRADASDKKGFDDRIGASINKMKANSVLLKTDSDDRWEVSPVLALVFGADEVAAVEVEMRRLAGEA